MITIQVADKPTLDAVYNEINHSTRGLSSIKTLIEERSGIIGTLNISLDNASAYTKELENDRLNEINKLMGGNILYLVESKTTMVEGYATSAAEYEQIAIDAAQEASNATTSSEAYESVLEAESAAQRAQEYANNATELLEEIEQLANSVTVE